MSFGWSAGDIVAAITFVNKIVQCVKNSGGAREHFQELETELQALSRALHEISDLANVVGQIPEIVALKFAACLCNDTLQTFLKKIEPFSKTLGTASKCSRVKAAPRMVRWELLVRKDVPEFRTYLVAHVGFLQVRQNNAILKITARSLEDSRRNHGHQQDAIKTTHQNLVSHMEVIRGHISSIPRENTVPRLDSLMFMMNNVLKCQNEMMQMFERGIRNPVPDLDHTWPQPPIKLEDPFGNTTYISSDFNWDMLEAVIQAKFKSGLGHSKVRSGEWELYDGLDSCGPYSITPETFAPIPGMHIIMTFIVGQYAVSKRCPRLGCSSRDIVASTTGVGRKCSRCHIWFRKSTASLPKPLKPDFLERIEDTNNEWDSSQTTKDMADLALKHGTRATDERRMYKNLSIYVTELGPTPTDFRERYTRNTSPISAERARKEILQGQRRDQFFDPVECAALEQARFNHGAVQEPEQTIRRIMSKIRLSDRVNSEKGEQAVHQVLSQVIGSHTTSNRYIASAVYHGIPRVAAKASRSAFPLSTLPQESTLDVSSINAVELIMNGMHSPSSTWDTNLRQICYVYRIKARARFWKEQLQGKYPKEEREQRMIIEHQIRTLKKSMIASQVLEPEIRDNSWECLRRIEAARAPFQVDLTGNCRWKIDLENEVESIKDLLANTGPTEMGGDSEETLLAWEKIDEEEDTQ